MFPVTWCDCCNLKPIALTFEPSKERWLFEKCEEMNLGNTFSLFSGSVVLIQKTYQIMLPLCQFVFKYQSILPYDCKIQYSIQRNITVHYCQQLKNLTGSCCSSLTGPGAGDESSRWRDGTINAFSQAMFAFPLFKLAFQHLYPWIGSTRSNKGWEGMVKKKKKHCCIQAALTWRKKPAPKWMSWYFDCCIPSQPSGQRMLQSTQKTKTILNHIFLSLIWTVGSVLSHHSEPRWWGWRWPGGRYFPSLSYPWCLCQGGSRVSLSPQVCLCNRQALTTNLGYLTLPVMKMWLWTNTDGCKQKGLILPLYVFVQGKLCCTNIPIQPEIYISIRWLTFTFESPNVPPVAVKRLDWCIGNELLRTTHLLFDTQFCEWLLILFYFAL